MAEWEPQPASTTAKKRRKPAEKCVLRIAPRTASRPEIRLSACLPPCFLFFRSFGIGRFPGNARFALGFSGPRGLPKVLTVRYLGILPDLLYSAKLSEVCRPASGLSR